MQWNDTELPSQPWADEAKMCDHEHSYPFMKLSDIRLDPNLDCCHIYAVHQDGTVFCQPDVALKDEAIGDVSETFCGDDRLTLMYVRIAAPRCS